MKKSARIALHCLLAMVLTVPLAACGSDTKDTTPKKDMSANTREQLAELAKSDERLTGELENKTIKWMSDWDINSDDTGKTTPIELAVFQERYGGQIEWYQTTYGSRYDNLANAINSDEGVDFFYGGNWDAFPKGAVRGMFVPYDNYIDLDSAVGRRKGCQRRYDVERRSLYGDRRSDRRQLCHYLQPQDHGRKRSG